MIDFITSTPFFVSNFTSFYERMEGERFDGSITFKRLHPYSPSSDEDHAHKRTGVQSSPPSSPRQQGLPWRIKDEGPNKDLMEIDIAQYHTILNNSGIYPPKPVKLVYKTTFNIISCLDTSCSIPSTTHPTDNPLVLNYEYTRNMFCNIIFFFSAHLIL